MNHSNRTNKRLSKFILNSVGCEFNDAFTRKRIRKELKKKFNLFSICDESNNPPDLVDSGNFCIHILFPRVGYRIPYTKFLITHLSRSFDYFWK